MALDLKAIHEALAGQIKAYLSDDWNVAPWPLSGKKGELIEVWPGSPYVGYFGSFGPNGHADVLLELRVYLPSADPATYGERTSRALSVGTGHGSSIPDAVMSDATLGGVVSSAKVLSAEWSPSTDGDEIRIPVEIIAKKQGAQV